MTSPSDAARTERIRRRLLSLPDFTAAPVCPWCGREVAPAEYDQHLGRCKGEG
jgi:hypothetical protein